MPNREVAPPAAAAEPAAEKKAEEPPKAAPKKDASMVRREQTGCRRPCDPGLEQLQKLHADFSMIFRCKV